VTAPARSLLASHSMAGPLAPGQDGPPRPHLGPAEPTGGDEPTGGEGSADAAGPTPIADAAGRDDPLLAALATLGFRIDALAATVVAMRSLVNDHLSDQDAKLDRSATLVDRSLASQRATGERLAESVANLAEQQGRTTQELHASIAAMRELLAEQAQRLEALERLATTVSEEIDAAGTALTAAVERSTSAQSRAASKASTTQARALERVSEVMEAILAHLEQQAAGGAAVARIESTLEGLTGAVDNLRRRIPVRAARPEH